MFASFILTSPALSKSQGFVPPTVYERCVAVVIDNLRIFFT